MRELILDRNDLDGRRLRILKDFIGMNTGLLSVSMNSCKLYQEGAFLIAQGLARNRKLKTLMISNNNITDDGLMHISEVLASNSSLEHFDLSKNTISD